MTMTFSLENPMAHDVLRLYENGMTPARIIDVKGFDCTVKTLTAWLRRNGATMREKNYFKFAPKNPDEVIELYQAGNSLGRVIEKLDLNTSRVTLRKWFIKNGIAVHEGDDIVRTLENKVCVVCRNTYRPTSNRQRFCNDCAPTNRIKSYLTRYGITPEQFEEAYIKANGCCELCGKKGDEKCRTNKLTIDHDHNTGEFRGLLCRGCNMKMSGVDDSEWLSRAFVYQNKKHTLPKIEVMKYQRKEVG